MSCALAWVFSEEQAIIEANDSSVPMYSWGTYKIIMEEQDDELTDEELDDILDMLKEPNESMERAANAPEYQGLGDWIEENRLSDDEITDLRGTPPTREDFERIRKELSDRYGPPVHPSAHISGADVPWYRKKDPLVIVWECTTCKTRAESIPCVPCKGKSDMLMVGVK